MYVLDYIQIKQAHVCTGCKQIADTTTALPDQLSFINFCPTQLVSCLYII